MWSVNGLYHPEGCLFIAFDLHSLNFNEVQFILLTFISNVSKKPLPGTGEMVQLLTCLPPKRRAWVQIPSIHIKCQPWQLESLASSTMRWRQADPGSSWPPRQSGRLDELQVQWVTPSLQVKRRVIESTSGLHLPVHKYLYIHLYEHMHFTPLRFQDKKVSQHQTSQSSDMIHRLTTEV